MIKKIMLAVLVLPAIQAFCLPGDTLHSPAKGVEKFGVTVQSVTGGAEGRKYENICPELTYDQKSNYSWYSLKKKWVTGQQYRLLFQQVPASGVLYIFTVDGMNTPVIYGVLHLDSMHGRNLEFPNGQRTLSLNYAGQERLCLWYAKHDITDYEETILGIEMTHGDFTARNNGQLGSSLLLPGASWNFTKKTIGFVARPGAGGIQDTAVLPIIIQFDIN